MNDWPSSVQAGAAVGSLLVTAWLARLTSRYVELTGKLSVATDRSVQQALDLADRQDRGTTAFLLAEVRRIRTELGPKPTADDPDPFSPGQAVPAIHPWTHSTMPSVARIVPAAVDEFLALDRYLNNHRLAMEIVADATGKYESIKAWAEAEEHQDPERDIAEAVGKDLERSHQVTVAERNVEAARRRATVTYRLCHGSLDKLSTALLPAATPPAATDLAKGAA